MPLRYNKSPSEMQQGDSFVSRSSESPCHADLLTSASEMIQQQQPVDFNGGNQKYATFSQNVKPTDVLCGRDKYSHAHVGNKRFRKLVMVYRQEYQEATSREQKSIITGKIVSTVTAYGGRFLKQDETTGEWKDVGDHYAREKVSHALRSAKDPNRPKIKKPREVKRHIPTADEDAIFETTLADQQHIFRSLLLNEVNGISSDIMVGGVESIFPPARRKSL